MQPTIKEITKTNLKRLNLTTTDHEIKKAYHRNYRHRQMKGLLSKPLIADQITRYLVINNKVTKRS